MTPADAPAAGNLYVHVPFCRRKCAYCALRSRAGVPPPERADYVAHIVRAVRDCRAAGLLSAPLGTVYFGGGSPALCDLGPVLAELAPLLADMTEFTVELHPLDADGETLRRLRDGGVNRISMGVQSLDDATLAQMGRGYASGDAERAFARIRSRFDNAGIDLIVGYPSPRAAGGADAESTFRGRLERLRNWGLRHCSVYALILEEGSALAHRLRTGAEDGTLLPSDDETMDRIRAVARFLAEIGLERYEISNYAAPGFACRHNLATWRGEDYVGLGEGAHGRMGRMRTQNWFGPGLPAGFGPLPPAVETVPAGSDRKERALFRLRTRDGLDATGWPEWERPLAKYREEGLLTESGGIHRLTDRGMEVCDSILADLV